MANFTLEVGQEVKIRCDIFGEDNQPGAAYNTTIPVIWVNGDDAVVQVQQDGSLKSTLKGVLAGQSTLTATVVNMHGASLTATSVVTVTDPVRDGVRAELVVDA